jgi:predicted XRE-type DNA-binding protein
MATQQTKAAQAMDRQYQGMGVQHRMKLAVSKVLNDGMSQSEAARRLGVSRPRLNERCKGELARLAEQQERSKVARAEQVAAASPAPAEPEAEPRPLVVQGETRRVPPFDQFARMYFGNLECPDCGVHHELPKLHLEMMDKITDPSIKRLLINCPPYHAKSTVATVQSTVYELCRDPNSRTLIVSKGQRLAERFLYSIVKHLTDPALYYGAEHNLIDDWGPFQLPGSKGWNANQIYVAGRVGAEKDPSVSCLGVGGQIYGIRADRILFDDIADLENQRNSERVQEMLKWATQEAASRVGKSGKLIFVGTRVSAGDIYSHLQNLPSFQVVRYPCIVDEETKMTLWPEHFGYENADLQRQSMSSEQWQLVYQNVDTPGFGASFPPEVVEACRDQDRIFGHYDPKWLLVAGLDPAGANSQAGFTALQLLGLDLDSGKRYLVDMVNAKQMKAPQLRDQIFDWADRYPLRELRVESNGLQSQLVQYNQEIVSFLTNRGVRVVPHITTGHNKWDANFGVESMAPLFYNQQISLPAGDLASRNRLRSLEDQLVTFPMGRVSDLVMSLWFAELGIRDIAQRSIIPMFDPRFKVPKRVARRRHVVDFAEQRILSPDVAADPFGRPMFPNPPGSREVKLVNVGGTITLPG